ncbi:hypothetical protein EYC84_003132 [Monilinia fructicola]|uniref:Uncharacterized protein n=1 Tax=Monilinia fructicola TaxID=38448 RepID=A0A5M9JV10_MONFR|nr:hypothetical protein EYC84_003132 [Monilinia fructicola]
MGCFADFSMSRSGFARIALFDCDVGFITFGPTKVLGAYGMKIDMDSKSLSQGLLLNPIFDFCTVSLTQRNRILSPITVWDISKSIPPSHSQLEMLCPNP